MWKVYVGYVVGFFSFFYAGYGLIILATGSYEGDIAGYIGATVFYALVSTIAFLFSKKMKNKVQNLSNRNQATHPEPVLDINNESKTTTNPSFPINDDPLKNADRKKVKTQTDQKNESLQNGVLNGQHASKKMVSGNSIDDTHPTGASNELVTEMPMEKNDEPLQPFNIVEEEVLLPPKRR